LLLAGLTVTIIVMLIVSGASYRTLQRAEASSHAVVRAEQVLQALEGILEIAVDAEAATRGYEVAADEGYLERMTRAIPSLRTAVEAVATLTDNSAQRRRIPTLRRQAAEAMDALQSIIATRLVGGEVTRAESDRQKARMDALRATLREMRFDEEHLLEIRVAADGQATQTTRSSVFAMLACVFVILFRDATKREQLSAALQRANEDLEIRVDSRTLELRQTLDSELSARREAQEASRLKDEFLMTVSHELRTPLTALYGWARMLATGEIREGQERRAIEAIERNASAQTQLVNDLLDVSRAISGKLRLDVRTVDLSAVVASAIDSIQPAAEAKGIRLQPVLDPNAGPVVGDSDRLQQIVWNLLANAVKFTAKGGRVQVRLERVNSHVELIVSDTGSGIATEFLPYVFDRFRQAQTGTTRQHTGLGLGLAIVRHLAELHGGSVRAESEGLGQGSTFRVMLPLTIARHDAQDSSRSHPTASDRPPVPLGRRLDTLRVLVVDDEPEARDLFSVVLENAGADVRAAASARDALVLIHAWSPDVLVSDIEMPQEDGYALIRNVRELDQFDDMVAIAITAHARPEDRVRAIEAGFAWHLQKPVEPVELVSVIAALSAGETASLGPNL
jgi:signal transduction histidine kinase/ActR/RegA family two-component response regulator